MLPEALSLVKRLFIFIFVAGVRSVGGGENGRNCVEIGILRAVAGRWS
jgi:hypothetical protein